MKNSEPTYLCAISILKQIFALDFSTLCQSEKEEKQRKRASLDDDDANNEERTTDNTVTYYETIT